MIPEAAVEAAARVLYLEDHLWDDPWETAASAEKYRTDARIALEAAAPHMLAEAIAQEYEAGADALGEGIPIYASNLRARAASIRAAK